MVFFKGYVALCFNSVRQRLIGQNMSFLFVPSLWLVTSPGSSKMFLTKGGVCL